jgi:site-specific recombinase XerD
MKIADAFEEFVAYATLERCLETNTIYWYKRCVRPFIKYLRYNALESTLENLSVKTLRAYFISHRQRGYETNSQWVRRFQSKIEEKEPKVVISCVKYR